MPNCMHLQVRYKLFDLGPRKNSEPTGSEEQSALFLPGQIIVLKTRGTLPLYSASFRFRLKARCSSTFLIRLARVGLPDLPMPTAPAL